MCGSPLEMRRPRPDGERVCFEQVGRSEHVTRAEAPEGEFVLRLALVARA